MSTPASKYTFIRLGALLLSPLAGYLLSKASLIGRTGINLFYKEYKFLKTGWQGTLLILVVLSILWFIHQTVQNRVSGKGRLLIHLLVTIVGIVGLLLTYQDFRDTLSHRLLGERFHLGAYLFWVAWLIISLSYVIQGKRRSV